MRELLTPERSLPADRSAATLIGRAWVPAGPHPGPSPVVVRDDGVYDLARVAPTVSELLNADDPVGLVRAAKDAPRLGDVGELLANSAAEGRDPSRPYLLAPCDLQAVKASGVTFVTSMLERVIEEQTRGDPARAAEVRAQITGIVGTDLRAVKPGSEAARRLKAVLVERGAWSQYLEVGIGPDAEIFTKCQPLASVGTGADIGLHPRSSWNNPEPEVVLAVSAAGRIVGATLGNDVNLRDVEGRSALLLPLAKDNNASSAIGPLIRLFDGTFGLDDVRRTEVRLRVEGTDGFVLSGSSSMAEIARDPTELVAQLIGDVHQYPDGAVLFCGTMFAPVEDRDAPGGGFTHKRGDVVAISAPELGALINRVDACDAVAPWTFGVGALMRNLAARGLLDRRPGATS
ncbi:MAG TPA: fumarylacetoacetate hydrolase family protein [Geminicoccaceae bacterium]|nr:fumarylacetoacetate hydrolase family protein [Geminicoccaceae bacterium]